MTDAFDTFNEQVETESETDGESPTQETQENDPHETQANEIAVVGDNNDRLRISAETSDGTQVEQEMTSEEVGRAMSFLGISDARDLENQPVLVWEMMMDPSISSSKPVSRDCNRHACRV
jgi:hypothetical protein